MHTKYLVLYDCRYWKPIETQGELLPNLEVILTFAFIVEAICSIDRATFVVASEQVELIRILYLISQQQTD